MYFFKREAVKHPWKQRPGSAAQRGQLWRWKGLDFSAVFLSGVIHRLVVFFSFFAAGCCCRCCCRNTVRRPLVARVLCNFRNDELLAVLRQTPPADCAPCSGVAVHRRTPRFSSAPFRGPLSNFLPGGRSQIFSSWSAYHFLRCHRRTCNSCNGLQLCLGPSRCCLFSLGAGPPLLRASIGKERWSLFAGASALGEPRLSGCL